MKLNAVSLAARIFPFSVERGVSRRLEPRPPQGKRHRPCSGGSCGGGVGCIPSYPLPPLPEENPEQCFQKTWNDEIEAIGRFRPEVRVRVSK